MTSRDDFPSQTDKAAQTGPKGDLPAYTAQEFELANDLVASHYEALLQVARVKRRRTGMGETLSTADLLHEGLLRAGARGHWQSEEHFVRCVVIAMRCVIIDYARKRATQKHAGRRVPLETAERVLPEFSESPEEIVLIGDLLEKLGQHNPRWLQVVDARYFGGMTEAEAAQILKLSERTVRRDWHDARAWLADNLR
jgi:RNA polymerase sigma factor (TIGR02999 family)